MVSSGPLQSADADQRTGPDDQTAMGWCFAVSCDTDDSGIPGRDQQSGAGGQAQGARISFNGESDHDDLSDCREAGSSAYPHEIARNLSCTNRFSPASTFSANEL